MTDKKNELVNGTFQELDVPLVRRSSVPERRNYKDYREELRIDFFHSCAYCTMSEAEALAIRFVIDHYEPRVIRRDLENIYGNLMYCCDECNSRKGDRCPPPEARAAGVRFFRPDHDVYSHNFSRNGVRIEGKSACGDFTIEALDLNRLALRRLRELRERLMKCDEYVEQGILCIKRFPIDRLPKEIKGRAAAQIRQAIAARDSCAGKIDDWLQKETRSPLLESENKSEMSEKERKTKLASLETLYPGAWRGRKWQPKEGEK